WNAPVPSFGSLDARILILGLAPGMQGANRTGRPFTGDWAGDLLYKVLLDLDLAQGIYDRRSDDGLRLINCRIANAVRCVPPQNKPIGQEMTACRPFLDREVAAMPNLKVIFSLGKIAHDAALRTMGHKVSAAKFTHNAVHKLVHKGGRSMMLVNSYHCSRYNTNTGRLTEEMFCTAMQSAKTAAGL
ncbi:MAG: uracil-DNA glycosylase, partial [Alphaproteobacteria bacterium]|nr:uracil-DNA glycosylase [Alphaproteobacteria bacterium]